jgi:hypothetical protein
MDPYATREIARQRQGDLLREAARRRAARASRPPAPWSLRGSVGLLLVRLGARVAGNDAVVLAGPVAARR